MKLEREQIIRPNNIICGFDGDIGSGCDGDAVAVTATAALAVAATKNTCFSAVYNYRIINNGKKRQSNNNCNISVIGTNQMQEKKLKKKKTD